LENVPEVDVKLLVIDPSVAYPEAEGVKEVIGDWPGEVVVLQPSLKAGHGPKPGDAYDAAGIVVMGSRASVHDDHRWLHDLGLWLDPLLDGRVEVPVLGICFGHQLIAYRRGGKVGHVHESRDQVQGLEETTLDRCRLVPDRATMRVVVSHNEEVKTLPAEFRIVARRPGVAIDGMEHERRPIFSYQFHPEARGDFLRAHKIDPSELDDSAVAEMSRLLAAFRAIAARGK
jgi:GMP synthase-like glutamine amidotransferase